MDTEMPIKTAYRRAPKKGDIVVIDYPQANAICVIGAVSEDPYLTDGAGRPGNPAYRFDYLCGVGLNGSTPYPLEGFIWLNDDFDNISIVGVNGYALPRNFYNIDVVKMFEDHGIQIEYV